MNERVEDAHGFACDSCGADMRFAPQSGELVCDHCGNRADLIEPASPQQLIELDLDKGLAQALPLAETQDVRVSQCENCGAQIEFGTDDHAAECPFCATPIVIGTGQQRTIKPKGVLPFALDQEDARDAMTNWLGGLWFAPNGLQKYARKGRKLTGIYVPFWTFDADSHSRYSGERGTVYYEERTVIRDGKHVQKRVQKVRWRAKSGQVQRFFDDVLVLASSSLPKRFTDALQPWDLTRMEPYQPEYLAGFQAEGYTISLNDGFVEARAIMDATIRRDVKFDIGGDRQRIHEVRTTLSDTTFKHVLLPVWIAAYKYRGKTYRFVVNGRSGKVKGERPWSWGKILIAVLAIAAFAAAMGYVAAISEATAG